jgi:ankyrin repeat protein
MLMNGADVTLKGNDDKIALHYAAMAGKLEVVKCLIEKGANVKAINKYGQTALHYAAMAGKLEVVKCLVDNGADVTIKDKYDSTALEVAKTDEIKDILTNALKNPKSISAKPTDTLQQSLTLFKAKLLSLAKALTK